MAIIIIWCYVLAACPHTNMEGGWQPSSTCQGEIGQKQIYWTKNQEVAKSNKKYFTQNGRWY